ncbi:MAG: type II toxin-antitoxin system HipA family toxin [Desulfocapsa sp.]|nr:MAG: type II toxin-antitoxin system HipA family toxin [Desulfocapsa sp.]
MVSYKEIEVRFTESPQKSFLVGTLAEKESNLFFEYDAKWLKRGLELSPFSLPLRSGLIQHLDRRYGPIFGLFDDSLPDGWGLLLMDRVFRSKNIDPSRISILDRLLYLGTQPMGALPYHPPTDTTFLDASPIHLQTLASEARAVYAGKASDILPELMRAGGSPGGARPKVLVGYNPVSGEMVSGEDDLPEGFEHWLVKFYAKTDSQDEGRIEYAYSIMARAAGIVMAETQLFAGEKDDSFFATRRFDRSADNRRFHIHSFSGLVQTDFRIPATDYNDIFKATSLLTRDFADLEQLFRRMVFNVLTHNRDDHAKNFSFIFDMQTGTWALSPAYDITCTDGPGGEHSTTVNGEGAHPSREQCIHLAGQYGISNRRAEEVFAEVVAAVLRWQEFSEHAGVLTKDMPQLIRGRIVPR